jgi:hypothetical protein
MPGLDSLLLEWQRRQNSDPLSDGLYSRWPLASCVHHIPSQFKIVPSSVLTNIIREGRINIMLFVQLNSELYPPFMEIFVTVIRRCSHGSRF